MTRTDERSHTITTCDGHSYHATTVREYDDTGEMYYVATSDGGPILSMFGGTRHEALHELTIAIELGMDAAIKERLAKWNQVLGD